MEIINNVTQSEIRDKNGKLPFKCHLKWVVVVEEKKLKSDKNDPDNDPVILKEYTLQNLHSLGQSFDKLILSKQIQYGNIVEIYLDNALSEKNNFLTSEIFKCTNIQVLSLRKNNLLALPADIGRLSQLRTLILTENFLTDRSIPYTLTFCKYLTTLHLDNNFLDALPGFLLEMPNLETVYRHGNDNYFKSTFLWFHSSKKDRVLPLIPHNKKDGLFYQPKSLQSYAILSVISSKINFFQPGILPTTLQDHISETYLKYVICACCSKAFCQGSGGFKVFTFKSPYLGNTCVPFQHWTCSRDCGVALEQPAQQAEQNQAREADRRYQRYIATIQHEIHLSPPLSQTSMHKHKHKHKSKHSCSLM